MTHVDVNGARLWIDERGNGSAVLFVHGGLGDQRLWEPQAHGLAARFRCIRYDLRFYGRSESPGMEFSSIADLYGVLAVWAPLGVDDVYRELWRATPDARGLPEGAKPRRREDAQLEQVSVPTLVVVPEHDPPAHREVGETAARRIPGAQLAYVDSDHYLTLRKPEQVSELLLEFLGAAAPAEE
jgi:pimeloyl-ACP methyl ester carboxylesterase